MAALTGCAALAREPDLAKQVTATALPPTSTPTAIPMIEAGSITVREGQDPGSWQVFGMISNISDEGLTDLELRVSIVAPGGSTLAQASALPALRQIPAGGTTAFQVDFEEVDTNIRAGMVHVELASSQVSTINPLKLTVNQVSARPNYEGGTSYLGYFTNTRLEYGRFRNAQAFMFDEQGDPIDAAELLLTLSNVEPRGRVPFRADFLRNYEGTWPEFYIDAVPDDDPYTGSPLWTAAEPRLFFTNQRLPLYLIEINNTAFAPQQMEGMLTISDGNDLLGVLPVHSPAPIPAQTSWYFTLEPALALPVEIRDDETALQELTAALNLDRIRTHGVENELKSVDIEISAIETIGGSVYLKGTLSNPYDQDLADPAVYATLRDTRGEVITANSVRIASSLPPDSSVDFTIPLWLPRGIDPTTLEFDINATALTIAEINR